MDGARVGAVTVALQILGGLLTGVIVGAVFSLVGAQAPAPPTAAGVAGVAGVTLGYYIVTKLRGHG